MMMRGIWIAVAVVSVACGKKPDRQPRDATLVGHGSADAATIDAATGANPEPTTPPPTLTIVKQTKGDCKTDYAAKPTRDPNPMCKVEGGTFMMGAKADDKTADSNERPAHAVKVSSFYIDQFEVTVAQVVFYLNTVKDNRCPFDELTKDKCFDDGGLSLLVEENGVYRPVAERDERYRSFFRGVYKYGIEKLPIGFVSFAGAQRYCAWAGKRLPSEAEFEYAARHDPKTGKDLRYPWGDTFAVNRTNCSDNDCKDEFGHVAPVGSFDGTHGRGDDSSPFGAHDMTGNEKEITSTCFAPYHVCEGPCLDEPVDLTATCVRMMRPGGWLSEYAQVTTTSHVGAVGGTGFRCAR